MDTQLKMLVQDYLRDHKSLSRLQSRLVDITWDMRNQVSSDCLTLADKLSLIIDEHTSGMLSQSELRAEIRDLVGPHFEPLNFVDWGSRRPLTVSTGTALHYAAEARAVSG